jgi:hypothetical protein
VAGLRDADHCFDGDLNRPSGRITRTRRNRCVDATPARVPYENDVAKCLEALQRRELKATRPIGSIPPPEHDHEVKMILGALTLELCTVRSIAGAWGGSARLVSAISEMEMADAAGV